MVNRTAVQYNLEHYPWAERVEVNDVDHSVGQFDNPEPIANEITRFFNAVAQQRT